MLNHSSNDVDQKRVENSSGILSRNIPVYKVKVSKFVSKFVLQSHLTNEIIEELDFINNNIHQIWDQLDNNILYTEAYWCHTFGHKPNSRKR